jgi:hypothetical protein
MNIKLLAPFFLGLSLQVLQAQETVSVSVGAGYQNQTWYSLQNGVQATQAKDNWDLGFEITGYSASIIANTQKPNFVLYKAPFSVLQWNGLDTTGISTWKPLYNSDSSWALGALNTTANLSNQFDLGWGLYDLNTHFVVGDSCYVLKLSTTGYKKLMIDNLANGAYNFTFADLDGSNEQQATIAKSAYTGKNFAYFNLTENKALDREPSTTAWDLTFTRYTAMLSSGGTTIPYPVVGILQNKGVTVAQANNVTDVATYNAYTSHTFATAINEIGSDWKGFDLNSNQWLIVRDTCYFVKDKSNKIWKLLFTGFSGSATGDFRFTKEALTTTAIVDHHGVETARFAVYPNPAVGDQLEVLFGAEVLNAALEASIVDMNGTIHAMKQISLTAGLSRLQMDVSALQPGVYCVAVKTNHETFVQKFVKP